MDTLARIERRHKLRDLRVIATVARLGSMGKAAVALNTSQPAISRSIAELEHTRGAATFSVANGAKRTLAEIEVGTVGRD